MESMRIAVPAEAHQGLDSPISGHFGHSPGFVLATIADGKVTEIETIENVPHTSCAGPVELLAKHDVKVLITRGMGMRPLLISQELGISVVIAPGGTVGETVENYLKGNMIQMGAEHTCRGGGAHH
ncbi:MAG: NifB/NifX family molybdenum-iron cluster-binding protein [Candidatus Thorarchaeota archaeon]